MGASGASDRIYSQEIVLEIFIFVGTIRPKIGKLTGKRSRVQKGQLTRARVEKSLS